MSQVRTLFFFIWIFTSLSIQAREMIFNDIRRNKSLFHLLILNTMDVKELINCQQYCILHYRCQAVNFNEKKKKCRLLKDSMFYCLPDMVIQDEQGWDYYGQIEISEKREGMVTSKLYCYPKERALVNGKILAVLPSVYENFILSISIKPGMNKDNTFRNVIHATQDGNNGYGNRLPVIWFYPNTNDILYFEFPFGNSVNSGYKTKQQLPESSYTTVTFSQLKNHANNQYYTQVLVNGEVKFNETATKPNIFKDVKLYAGDVWHAISDATIKHLVYYTFEE